MSSGNDPEEKEKILIRHTLTDKQKRFLRTEGMKREPVVSIGKEGVTAALVQSARAVIKKQELIKVRVQRNAPEEPRTLIEMLAERSDADLVQLIGRNALLWKRNFESPKIELP